MGRKIGILIVVILIMNVFMFSCGLVKNVDNPNKKLTPTEYINTIILENSYKYHYNNKRK